MHRLLKRVVATVSVVLLVTLVCTTAQSAKQPFMVPMRDGVKLATDVHLPEGEGPWPVVLTRTPYNKNVAPEVAMGLTKKGYAVVAQDMRGRFASEGDDFLVFSHDGWGEHQDGYDTVEWIAEQKWCNGKVGTAGGSACGIVQNMMAPSRPPHLVCQWVLVACSSMYHQAMYQGGAFHKNMVEGWLEQTRLNPENLKIVRAHPEFDKLWQQVDAELAASRVNVPAMFIGGWYDIFSQGTINSFVTVQNNGDEGAKGKCKLVMGPFGHGFFTDLTYPNNQTPKAADHWNWFEAWLKNDGKGAEKIPTVHYYVMGDPTDSNAPGNEWRTADTWPIPAKLTPFYFHADGTLDTTASKEEKASRSYEYDPKNPVPTVGGANLLIPLGPKDQRKEESRPDVLLFTSDVLKEPIEVTGRIKTILWASSSAPDTDYTAELTDVYPDGRSMLVLDGILRARYRNGFEKSELMKPGEIYKFEVDLWSTSIVFNRGHRIRVAISSSNSPRFEPNPNTGEHSGHSEKTAVATNTIYFDAAHTSHILLPLPAPQSVTPASSPASSSAANTSRRSP